MDNTYWSEMIDNPLNGRVEKPRISGLTMVIDTGIPISMMRDLLELSSDHIDFWKFGFASASVCPRERVMDKVSLCQEYGVFAYPGGTSLEIAVSQNRWKPYLESVWYHGLRVVEVSDGTIDLPLRLRREIIRTARKMGFTVLSEVGKKVPGSFLPITEQSQLIQGDLNSGANYIIVEGREAGVGIGVYDPQGDVRDNDVQMLLDALGPLSTRLMWEAPLGKQQAYYVKKLGNKVNLGNIRPLDIVTLESLRRGFRSDTLRTALGLADVVEGSLKVASNTNPSVEAADESHPSVGTRPTLWTGSATNPASKSRSTNIIRGKDVGEIINNTERNDKKKF